MKDWKTHLFGFASTALRLPLIILLPKPYDPVERYYLI